MHKFALSLMALSLGALAAPAFATDLIPYGNVGHVAPTPTITATGNMLDIYFYGSSAGDADDIQVRDVTQGWTSGLILDNHSSTPGVSEYVFPTGTNQMLLGDHLEFLLVDQSSGKTYSSNP